MHCTKNYRVHGGGPSSSPYAFGLVPVRMEACVDYRGVKKFTVPDKYPMPRIDELINHVREVPTSLDLMKGVTRSRWQRSPSPRLGLFQYRRIPFGLTNVPATFQWFNRKEQNFVFVYLDDLLIVSRSISEHVEHVGKVLERPTCN